MWTIQIYFKPEAEINRKYWKNLATTYGGTMSRIQFFSDGTGPRTTIDNVPKEMADELIDRIAATKEVDECVGCGDK